MASHDFSMVSQFFLYGLYIIRNLLLLVKLMITSLELFFVFHIFDWFLKKFFIKWNTVKKIYVKTHKHTQREYYLMKHTSIKKIRKIFDSCSNWTTSRQCRRSCQSRKDWCCWNIVLFILLFVEHCGVFCWASNVQVGKRCWGKLGINFWSKDSVYIQLTNLSVGFNIIQIR